MQFSLAYVVEPGAATAALVESASRRLSAGFRPATLSAYTRMFYAFLAFLITAGPWLPQVFEVLAFSTYFKQV